MTAEVSCVLPSPYRHGYANESSAAIMTFLFTTHSVQQSQPCWEQIPKGARNLQLYSQNLHILG